MIGEGTFPKELNNKYDVVIATGMFSMGHVKPAGADDILDSLKPGGYTFFSVRDKNMDLVGFTEKFKSLE